MLKMYSLIYLSLLLSPTPAATLKDLNTKKPTPEAAQKMLEEGNARFVAGAPKRPHQDKARLQQAAAEDQGNHAYATVLSCADSRVPVEMIFDAGIMDTFVIRMAGNVVGTNEAGSIEYGLAHVHTPILVILGHSQCGAVKAVTQVLRGEELELERNIPPLVAPIIPAAQRAIEKHPEKTGLSVLPHAIKENVLQSMKDLLTQSPAIFNMAQSGKVKVVGAVYHLETGKVEFMPDARTTEIINKVKADPNRPTEPMAK